MPAPTHLSPTAQKAEYPTSQWAEDGHTRATPPTPGTLTCWPGPTLLVAPPVPRLPASGHQLRLAECYPTALTEREAEHWRCQVKTSSLLRQAMLRTFCASVFSYRNRNSSAHHLLDGREGGIPTTSPHEVDPTNQGPSGSPGEICNYQFFPKAHWPPTIPWHI